MATMTAISGYHYAPLQYPAYSFPYNTSLHWSPPPYYTMNTYQHAQQPLQRLAQSRSKADFFKQLGWNERSEADKRLYGLMKEEASRARNSLTNDRGNLVQEAANDPNVQPPFSSSQMTETALWREVVRIWENASAETKVIYDLGAYPEGGNQDNWIIRWVLWHVFRYRDVRNRNRNSQARERSASSSGSPPSPTTTVNAGRVPYDPVRDAHAYNGSPSRRYS